MTPFTGRKSKVEVTRPINAEMENVSYPANGRPTNFKLNVRMEHNDMHHRHVQ